MRTGTRIIFVVVALGAVVLGCRDEIMEPAQELPSISDLSQELGPGIHPVVSLPVASAWRNGPTPVRIHLLTVGVDLRIQSYQGWIRFDPGLIEVIDGSSPEGVLGAWNETSPGELRFAGVSLDGVGDSHVIELSVKTSRPLVAGDLAISLDEVTGDQATATFQNLMSDVRISEVAPAMALRPTVR